MKTCIVLLLLGLACVSANNAHRKIMNVMKRQLGNDYPQAENSTVVAGLDMEEFSRPMGKDVLEMMLEPVTEKDKEMLEGFLNKTAADVMVIVEGFFTVFMQAEFKSMEDLGDAMMKVYNDYIVDSEIDLEGLNDYVNSLIVRAAILAGTDFEELQQIGLNEPGCIDRENPNKTLEELGCILERAKMLDEAIEMRQWMTFAELFDYEEDPLEFCDQVYWVMDLPPCAINAEMIANSMVDLVHCTFRNGGRILERMDPDRQNYYGEPVVPNLPIPRLLHLQSFMEAFQMQGMNVYYSFMTVGYFLGEEERKNAEEAKEKAEQLHRRALSAAARK